MKTNILILTAAILFGLTTFGHAQNTIQINKQDGSKVNTTISDVRKLTFPSGNLVVTKKDGNTITYVLTDLKYINFSSGNTSVPSVSEMNGLELRLYPNPVVNELYINLMDLKINSADVTVLNASGAVLFQQQMANPTILNFDATALPAGIYFCTVKANGKTLVGKFIK